MTLSARAPRAGESRRRLWRLGFTRRITPLVGLGGRRWVRARIARHLRAPPATPGFFLPLTWVEAANGRLPTKRLLVDQIHSILADWVDCGGVMRNTTDYFLGVGDWQPIIRSTHGDRVREEARQLLSESLNYHRTVVYESLVRAALEGSPQRRQGRILKTREDVDAYFSRFVKLFKSIERHGLLPDAGLDAAAVRFNKDRGLGVAVDADGRLHRLQGGNHRWAIAQVLGLKEVPVEFRLHHVRGYVVGEDSSTNLDNSYP